MTRQKIKQYYIDINCDLGEGKTTDDCEKDARVMPYISSCNITCGGHAGNHLTMNESVKSAIAHQLKIGAHPGYPDKENFGRRSISVSLQKLKQSIKFQIDSLKNIANNQEAQLNHIKFHGALYNDIESDKILAFELAYFCLNEYPNIKLMGLSAGYLKPACKKLGIDFISEGFMDRRYLSNGLLTPRSRQGAVIQDPDTIIKQAINLAKNQAIISIEGESIRPIVNSICLHGDNPNAISIAKKLHHSMSESNISLLK